jgi:acetyltransferase-like isoleucine patch superfamily enzyme
MRKITRDSFPHLTVCMLDMLRGSFSSMHARMLASFWRVSLGKECRFFGTPMFRRHPGSKISVGTNCQFRSAVWSNFAGINHRCIIATLSQEAEIRIGNGCGFSGAAIGAAQSVIIGNGVMVGANASISDTDWHPVDPVLRNARHVGASSPVVIDDEVWLGANVVVLKGVRIGAGTTIAANSVVTRSIPAGVVAAGIPARPLRSINGAE